MATAKETTTKKTTPKKTTKKKEEVVETTQGMTMEQMQMMMMQMMSQMQQMQQQKVSEEKKPTKKDGILKNRNYLRKNRNDDEVEVRSVCGDGDILIFNSKKTNTEFVWRGNEIEYLTIGQILEMYSSPCKSLLTTPYLIIEDDEVNEVLGLSKLIDTTEELSNFENIIEMTSIEIENLLAKATPEFKKNFGVIVLEKIKNKELKDMVIVNELGRILNIDYKLYLD